jgi:integrase
MVMAGVDIWTVAYLMGHATIQMTMRYAHLAPGHNREAVDRQASFGQLMNKSATSDRARKRLKF